MRRSLLLSCLLGLVLAAFLLPSSGSAGPLGLKRTAAISLDFACALKKNGSLRYVDD